jgi:hypothetical protein
MPIEDQHLAAPKSNAIALHRFIIALFMHFDNKGSYFNGSQTGALNENL